MLNNDAHATRRITLILCFATAVAALAVLMVWADARNPDRSPIDEAPEVLPARSAGSSGVFTRAVTLPTYPYEDCLGPSQPGVAGVPYQPMNWTCWITAGRPVSRTYTELVLSNEFLTVTLLPELGGRIYEMIFKPTGNNELYRNPVIKPTPWGPAEQGWWLAAGGIEWGFPTEEHGYLWGVPWHYGIQSDHDGVTVTVQDGIGVERPNISVDVHLPADRAVLEISPKIANPTADSADIKYWTNAMLAPGEVNSPTANLRFLFPGSHVLVHSSDDPDLPSPGELMDWPWYGGRDYSQLGNWDQWLGFFEYPQAHGPFAGVYDSAADEGVVRVFPSDVALGSKAYAHGWSDPVPPFVWTDGGSGYVEIHGGLARTFWDSATLAPGQIIRWTETWYPVAGVGGVGVATEEAALRFEQNNGDLVMGLYVPSRKDNVDLQLWRRDYVLQDSWRISHIAPANPFAVEVPGQGTPLTELVLLAISEDGRVLASFPHEDQIAPLAGVDPLPFYVTVPTFTVSWSGEDLFTGIDHYDVQFRAGYEGEWVPWLGGSSETSAQFHGENGETYFFRVRATDRMGNRGSFGDDEWGQASTSILLNPAPVLAASRKLVHPETPGMSQAVDYTILISNTGSLAANGVAMTDYLPATLDLVTGTLNAGRFDPSGRVITWQGLVSPGQQILLSYRMQPTSSTATGVSLTNSMQVRADGIAQFVRSAAVVFRHIRYLPLLAKGELRPPGQ